MECLLRLVQRLGPVVGIRFNARRLSLHEPERRLLRQRIWCRRKHQPTRGKSGQTEERWPMASRGIPGHPPRKGVGGTEVSALYLGHVRLVHVRLHELLAS